MRLDAITRACACVPSPCRVGAWALAWFCTWGLAWANNPSPDRPSALDSSGQQVEISTEVEIGTGRVILRLQGQGQTGQVLQLQQNGLVFLEQRLSEGPFQMYPVRPFHPSADVTLRVRTPGLADDSITIPLLGAQKRSMANRQNRLMAPRPLAIPKEKQPSAPANDEEVEFDADFLRGKSFRDMDASTIKKLGRARPGQVDVDVYRNGTLVTKTNVTFTLPEGGGEARACVQKALFMQLGIKPENVSPAGLALLKQTSDNDCLYMHQWVEGALDQYDVSELRLDLTVPQAFLSRLSRTTVPPEMLTRGVNAGFVNYNFNHFEASGQSSDFLGLNSGINVEGWQVRHTSYLSQNSGAGVDNKQQYVAGETFVRRPLIDWKSSLALGEINSASPILGGLPLRGLRLASEEGLMSDEERSYRPVVRGVARSNARVRMLQNGAVFFELTVPPGPFELTDLNPPSSVGNLTLSITESDGSTQNFIVPYSLTAGKLNPGSARYSLSVGQYRSSGDANEPTLLQAYLRYGLNTYITPGMEWMTSPGYNGVGLQLAFSNPWGTLAINRAQTLGSGRYGVDTAGHNQSISYSAPVMGPLTIYGGVSQQSLGYVSPIAALSSNGSDPYNPLSPKRSLYLSLGLGLQSWGGLSLSAVEQTTWTEGRVTQQYRLSYNTLAKSLSFSVYLAQTIYTDGTPPVDSVGLSVSVPLSSLASGAGIRYSQNQTGTQVPSQTLSAFGSGLDNRLSYNLNQSQTGSSGTSSASANWQHGYGSLGLNLSGSNNSGNTQVGLSAAGGLVLHSNGVILSPTLGPTFAIVELPQGEGASLSGSAARINRSGYGVMPNLSAYYLNDVQISLEGASAELEVDNTSQKVAPVEGSIVRLQFNASTGRPLLVSLQSSRGVRIPIGGSVTDDLGNEVGTVGQGSRALVRVKKPKGRLKVQWGDKPDQACQSDYALSDDLVANASGFTRLQLRCEPLVASDQSTQAER